MIPYFSWTVIQVGPLTLQVWGLFAGIGVVLASWFGITLAKKKGIDTEKFESVGTWVIVWAFIGARLFNVFVYEWDFYSQDPALIFNVLRGGLSVIGGFIGATAAFLWGVRKRAMPLLRSADVMVQALPLGLGCGRIGCFLIHDHPGTLSHSFIAVKYPGGARFDLGLLLGIFDFLLFGLFLFLMKKPRKDGFYLVLFMLIYGPVRFLLDFLRASDLIISDTRYFGLTPAQYASIAIFTGGIYLFLKQKKPRQITGR